jgi:hypothetical protein
METGIMTEQDDTYDGFYGGSEDYLKMKTKPTVYYKRLTRIREWEYPIDDEIKYVATIEEVKRHPYLGNEAIVHTSYIVKMPDGKGTFETKNTIYIKG